MKRVLISLAMLFLPVGLAVAQPVSADDSVDPLAIDQIVDEYIERYLAMFPTEATAQGDHRFDRELENFTGVRLADWLDFNESTVASLEAVEALSSGSPASQLDARAVLRQARRELFRHQRLQVSRTNPLFWTGIVGGMSTHLLVRDDLPLSERLRALAVRVGEVPRFCQQARTALEGTSPEDLAEMYVSRAAGQAASSASFFADGLAQAVDGLPEAERDEMRVRLDTVGQAAAESLRELADFLGKVAKTASGSARLGEVYSENLRLGTGLDLAVDQVLHDAERRLVQERLRAADFCRSIWKSQEIDQSSGLAEPPEDEKVVVRACFARIALDHAEDLTEFVGDFRRLAAEAEEFAVREGLVEIPEGFRLFVDTSPAYFGGQGVGGVYPPGPFAPDGIVMLFVPSYPDDTPAEAVAAFHRDFNDHFNTMVTPHETVPGHGAQIALAAHRAARTGEVARELFADGVYVEGWGTFSELLMLDAGWGGPLDRVAHLKKRLENIARLIVDIRVHTTDATEEDILRFVRDEALQDEQFAANMWRRALLTSPQLASYDLGSRRIYSLYESERERLGDAFDAGAFVRSMTGLGSVSLDAYEAVFASGGLLSSAIAMQAPSVRPQTGSQHGL